MAVLYINTIGKKIKLYLELKKNIKIIFQLLYVDFILYTKKYEILLDYVIVPSLKIIKNNV